VQAIQHDIRSTNEIYHLPLINPVARIIGSERNISGGQHALNATQLADVLASDWPRSWQDFFASSDWPRSFKKDFSVALV
jgi:hypothetical protein